MKRPEKLSVWRPPTRRSFVAMLASAAAVAMLKPKPEARGPRPKKIWIGHF